LIRVQPATGSWPLRAASISSSLSRLYLFAAALRSAVFGFRWSLVVLHRPLTSIHTCRGSRQESIRATACSNSGRLTLACRLPDGRPGREHVYAGFGDLGLRDKCCYVEDRFPRLMSLEDPVSGIALVEAARTQAIGHRTTDSAKSKALSESWGRCVESQARMLPTGPQNLRSSWSMQSSTCSSRLSVVYPPCHSTARSDTKATDPNGQPNADR
jgi:hypothetical protein